MPSESNESRLNRYKARLTDEISDSEVGYCTPSIERYKLYRIIYMILFQALKLLLKLRQIRPVTFQLLQQTRIGNAVNSWKQRNSGRLDDKTLRQADKLIQG